MYLFLSVFFLLYGGMHVYFFLKARAAFGFGWVAASFCALFLLAMIFAPLVVHALERLGADLFARWLSLLGYTWMGLLFLFCASSLALDGYRFFLYGAGVVFRRDFSALTLPFCPAFFASLLLSLAIGIYGYFEALSIHTEKIVIQTPKISKAIGRLRIVQISDIHLGLIVREKRLQKILTAVKAAKPDIVVSTGDLVDGQMDDLSGLAESFQDMTPPYGKYAVTGNHEFYAGLDQALDFTREAGFRILRGESLTVAGLVNIAGVDDMAGKTFGLYNEISAKEALARLPREKFTVLLKHRPLIDQNLVGLFDLQLSGHAHKGQIFPFSLITRIYYPTDQGLLRLNKNSYLYVNRGSGTWGPPIRFLSPPEITIIDLVYKRNIDLEKEVGPGK